MGVAANGYGCHHLGDANRFEVGLESQISGAGFCAPANSPPSVREREFHQQSLYAQ
jgi:hypothetical protein